MERKLWVAFVVGLALCFGVAMSAPITFAASSAPAKVAATAGKPMAKKMHVAKAKPNAKIKAAQEVLIKDGAKIKADGFLGKQTRSAIKSFQKKNMLKVTGKLDKETMAKLK